MLSEPECDRAAARRWLPKADGGIVLDRQHPQPPRVRTKRADMESAPTESVRTTRSRTECAIVRRGGGHFVTLFRICNLLEMPADKSLTAIVRLLGVIRLASRLKTNNTHKPHGHAPNERFFVGEAWGISATFYTHKNSMKCPTRPLQPSCTFFKDGLLPEDPLTLFL